MCMYMHIMKHIHKGAQTCSDWQYFYKVCYTLVTEHTLQCTVNRISKVGRRSFGTALTALVHEKIFNCPRHNRKNVLDESTFSHLKLVH